MFRMIIIGALAIGCAAGQASVPKGATEIEPGVFKHTDSAGKTFVYRKTPFGVVKSAENKSAEPASKSEPVAAKPEASAEAAKPAASAKASPFGNVKQNSKAQEVRVVEKGDTLHFERPSPFGGYQWTKKKDELTDEERAWWTQSQAARASNAAGAGSKE